MRPLYSAARPAASAEANYPQHEELRLISNSHRSCGRRESRLFPADVPARNSVPEEISSRTTGALKSEPLLVPSAPAKVYETQLEGRTVLHRTRFLCTSKLHFRHPGCDFPAELAANEHLGWCRKTLDRIGDRLCPATGFPEASRSIGSLRFPQGRNMGAAWRIRSGI
jgi:hypothetical protein